MIFRAPLLLFAVCLLLTAGAEHARAVTRYVKTTGITTGNGDSPAAAWSMARAVTSALPGDTVLVQPGIYSGKYTITATGTAAQPITFQADGPPGTVIIDGTGLPGANDGLFYITAGNGATRGHLKIIGFEMRNYTVGDGSGIRLRTGGTGVLTNVEIRNCRIHDIRGTNAMGITVYAANPVTAISGVLIDGCEIYNCEPAPSETIAINGNVDGFVISNCIVRDSNNIGIDMIGGESGFPAGNPAGKVTRNGIVRGCRVERCIGGGPSEGISAAGIYVDGAVNILIENNYVTGCDFGIEVGAENSLTVTGVKVRQNVIFKNRRSGLIFGAPDFSTGNVTGCSFTNNVLYRNDTLDEESAEMHAQASSGNVIENNIFFADGDNTLTFIYAEEAAFGAQTLRHNWFYSTLGSSSGSFDWNISRWGYTAFSAAGGNPGGGFGDPRFVNPEGGDFHLLPDSPCLDRGITGTDIATGLLTDMDGFPRLRGPAPECGIDEIFPVDAWFRTAFPGQPLSPARLEFDSDGDSVSDWLEYATGFAPGNPAQFPVPGMSIVSSGGQRYPQVQYFSNPAATDVELRLVAAPGMSGWTQPAVPAPQSVPDGTGRNRFTWTLTDPVSAAQRRFLRVSAVRVP